MNKNFVITINENKKYLSLTGDGQAIIGKINVEYELLQINQQNYLLRINNYFYEVCIDKIDDQKYSLIVNGNKVETITRTELQERAAEVINEATNSANRKVEIKAPMPGLILKIKKKIGETIMQGESILILEAMKMENDLKVPVSGIIKEISVIEGSTVEKGDKLFLIE